MKPSEMIQQVLDSGIYGTKFDFMCNALSKTFGERAAHQVHQLIHEKLEGYACLYTYLKVRNEPTGSGTRIRFWKNFVKQLQRKGM